MPLFGGGTQRALGADVAAVFQEVGERVRAQRVALFGGLAQPVLGGRLVAALAVVPAERVRGGGGSGDGGDAPPAGRLVRVAALVEQDAQVVGGGPVALGGGAAQIGLGAVEIAAAQQQGAEHAHRLGVAAVGGTPVPRLGLGVSGVSILIGACLHKPPCLQQSCPVPHKYHRRTTRNPRTPGIPQPVRSLQRFVDMPTERQAKPVVPNSPREDQFSHRKVPATGNRTSSAGPGAHTTRARILERIRALVSE